MKSGMYYKFRAWHKESGEILRNESQQYEGQVFQWLSEGQPIEILQFTGCYDKNGVDIYCGDIVEWTDSDGKTNRTIVEFNRGHFFIVNYDYTIDAYPALTVVGNIYET